MTAHPPSDAPTTLGECQPGDQVHIPGWSAACLVGGRSTTMPEFVRVDEITSLGDLGDFAWVRDDTVCYLIGGTP